MWALTVQPGKGGSGRLEEVPEPPLSDGPVLVETLRIGICGTDRDILGGHYGQAPLGKSRLILGHESLGRVAEAPPGSGLSPGDLVVGIVRRPDPVPCLNCGSGEWDMCRNGLYTERGIKERDGYASERFRARPEFLVKVDPGLGGLGVLLEPASVVAKAWEHVERIGSRARWEPERALVTGAGPVGLLAALLGVERGLEVHVLDRETSGPKPALVEKLGARYHTGDLQKSCPPVDVVIECTGAAPLVFAAINRLTPGGVVCLTGISSGSHQVTIDADSLNRTLVLENNVVFGSVNANRRHYQAAAEGLARAERGWLEGLITRRIPLAAWKEALERAVQDVKTVLEFEEPKSGGGGPPR
jgi:threonine dehydrogenase-like Zn-dependent dehydrogenase